jgi:hypothetical protein
MAGCQLQSVKPLLAEKFSPTFSCAGPSVVLARPEKEKQKIMAQQ